MSKKEEKIELSKGALMEENLRDYFRGLGYFVVRGAEYTFKSNDVTDIDLLLFSRFSSMTRERINVDIKNRRTPQAIERIFWAKGVQRSLNFDKCIVATTDKRSDVREFGNKVNVKVLDGKFLNKLKPRGNGRLAEEEFLDLINFESGAQYAKEWKSVYENSKSRLIDNLDFSGLNSNLTDINQLIQDTLTDTQRKEISCRVLYALVSHFLVLIDYLLKDIAFLDDNEKKSELANGLKYGNLGEKGVQKAVDLLKNIEGTRKSKVLDLFENLDISILVEFFSKNENMKQLFNYARNFELLAFKKEFIAPGHLPPENKSILFLLLDHLDIDRKTFADLFER